MKYISVNGPLKSESNERLVELFRDHGNALIMRSILMNEKEFITTNHNRSLRGFWYNVVKPVLSRAGVLDRMAVKKGKPIFKDGKPVFVEWDSELSRYLGELVKKGVMTYRDLRIIDTSRQREIGHKGYDITSLESYGFQVSTGDNPNVILCIEKDTTFQLLRQVASILGCSWISGKGQNALSATEDLLSKIPEDKRQNLVFLSFTDYDKSGYSIAQTFAEQADPYRERLGIETIEAERLGINPDQLTKQEVENNKFIPKGGPKDQAAWLEMSGGINGEFFGLELDAFEEEPERLRNILINGIRKYVRPESLTDFITSSYIKQAALQAIEPFIDEMMEQLIEKYKDVITVNDFDIYDYAIAGDSTLPISELCDRSHDKEIEKTAVKILSKIGHEGKDIF